MAGAAAFVAAEAVVVSASARALARITLIMTFPLLVTARRRRKRGYDGGLGRARASLHWSSGSLRVRSSSLISVSSAISVGSAGASGPFFISLRPIAPFRKTMKARRRRSSLFDKLTAAALRPLRPLTIGWPVPRSARSAFQVQASGRLKTVRDESRIPRVAYNRPCRHDSTLMI